MCMFLQTQAQILNMELDELEDGLDWMANGWLNVNEDHLTHKFSTNEELTNAIDLHNNELSKSGHKILKNAEEVVKDKYVLFYNFKILSLGAAHI